MKFDNNEWILNITKDILFNSDKNISIRLKTYKGPTTSDSFSYFSFHKGLESQSFLFLYAQESDVVLVNKQAANNKHSNAFVDSQLWDQLNNWFYNGIPNVETNEYDDDYWR